jgi:hypothetical protein
MYRVAGADIQNVYTIKINNMDRHAHVYDIYVEGAYPFELQGYRPMPIAEGEIFTIPVRVTVPREQLTDVQTDLTIRIEARDNEKISAQHTTSFIGPQLRNR